MGIELKENEWAEKMIRSRSLGDKPTETLRRIARYYMDKGYGKRDVRTLLEVFLTQCIDGVSLPKWSGTLDIAIKMALKYEAVDIDCINITVPEMEKIKALDGKQIKRLAFTLLCLAKYKSVVNPTLDFWVTDKDSDIMSMANINTSIKRQSAMYHTLNELGMVQFAKKVDNTNVRVCFVEDGETALRVTDFRNLGYQYLKYIGEPYIECQNCGLTVKKDSPAKGRPQKYCKDCSIEVAIRQRVDSVMRQRRALGTSAVEKKSTPKTLEI